MIKFIKIQFLVALALVKANREYISVTELNKFRAKYKNKMSKLDYQWLYSSNYLEQLSIDYSDFFEIKENIIHSKINTNELIKYFVAYLPNEFLKLF